MPGIFLKCELSPVLKFLLNGNFLLAWLVGGLRDTRGAIGTFIIY